MPLFSVIKPESSGLWFINTLIESDSVNPVDYQYTYNGSGVAVGDVSGDGLPDVFFGSSMGSCKLFLNKGNMQFEDVTGKAGVGANRWVTGVTMADVNADGRLDIYVCCSGKRAGPEGRANLLYINSGNLRFEEQAAAYGLDDRGYSCQATFFDYDRDNDLDLFVINQPVEINFTILDKSVINSKTGPYSSSHFYRNDGKGKFSNVTREAGVQSYAFSLSCTAGDLNNDGWTDLYVCNDYTMSDFLYINNKNGTFTDENFARLKHTSNFAMGSDIADFNNDALPDILQTDMLPESNARQKLMLGPNNYDRYYFLIDKGYGSQLMQNCLQLNNGNGTFSEIAAFAGIEKTDWSWAALFADFDNDGWKDIFINNGYLRDFTNMDQILYRSEILRKNNNKIPDPLEVVKTIPSTALKSFVFHNNRDLTFTNMAEAWGLSEKVFSNGAAYADLDNDGDLDLVINNLNQPATLYRNNVETRDSSNYLLFRLKGPQGNPEGTGTRILLFTGNNLQDAFSMPVRGYCSAVDARIHFGLGGAQRADSACILWPDGKTERLYGITAGATITVDYTKAKHENGLDNLLKRKNLSRPLMEEVIASGLDFRHRENDYIDFKREPLLACMHSRSGPALAAADINRDGLEDLFAGGARGQPGMIYLQQPNGKFSKTIQPALERDRDQEDVDALFFDADQDGDQDLYVVSGGSEVSGYSPWYQDRLYLNNGNGSFQPSVSALPEIRSSGGCVVAADIDGDGDQDLFRGGRLSPGNYPYHPQSFLLENNRGVFRDIAEKAAPGLAYTGMVTAAAWKDLNGDHQPDLVLAGEWMPLKVYLNQKGKLMEATTSSGLDYSGGWWNCIGFDDFDKDGDVDLVAGNMGTNTRIRTSPSNPAVVYARDFDANGSTDAFICHMFSDSLVYPMNSRDELIDQVRSLRKTIPTYQAYANMTMDQLIPAAELSKGLVEKAYTFHTSWFENDGKGSFIIHALPGLAQVSQVNSLLTGDFNADGNPDILMAGNNYALSPVQGRLDAGTGLILASDGKGGFRQLTSAESGFFAGRDVRKVIRVKSIDGRILFITGNNDDVLQVFKRRE